jgi:hypothetical protein
LFFPFVNRAFGGGIATFFWTWTEPIQNRKLH